jgi:hypothetical protein
MQKIFEGHVDLQLLTKQIVQFFQSRKFDQILATQNAGGYQIVAGDSNMYRMKTDLTVDIRRQAEGFLISLEPAKDVKRFSYPMILATFFGAGYFFLKDLKAEESWRKIEREFWHETNAMVAQARKHEDSSS